MALKSMSIEKLRDLKDKVEAAIHANIVGRRRELESELSKLIAVRGRACRRKGRQGWRERIGGSQIPQSREPCRDLGWPRIEATLVGRRDQVGQKAGRLSLLQGRQDFPINATEEGSEGAGQKIAASPSCASMASTPQHRNLVQDRRPPRYVARQRLPDVGLDKPNCLAICDGLTPTLKAARPAFIFPGVR